MYIYDAIISLLGLKKRNTPSRENWIEYADFSEGLPTRVFSDANFFILFMLILSVVFNSDCLLVAFFCVVYRVSKRIGREIDRDHEKEYKPQMLVNAIQLRHNQTLKEILKEEPALINSVYQKKSLLTWAIHYKNLEAHKLLLILMKESINKKK